MLRMWRVLLLSFAFALGLASAISTSANQYFFGDTPYGTQQLILSTTTGSETLTATNTGWYSSTGVHSNTIPNYIIGNCTSGCAYSYYNDYFVFNLSGVTGTITAASLSIGNKSGTFDDSPSSTVSIYDVSTSISSLEASQTVAASIFSDLESGILYGSTTVTSANNLAQVPITLDASAISALNSDIGSAFALGGTLFPGAPVTNTPEPRSLAMLATGLMALGFYRRRRRV